MKATPFDALLIADVPIPITFSTSNDFQIGSNVSKAATARSIASGVSVFSDIPPFPSATPILALCNSSMCFPVTEAITKLNVFVPKSMTAIFILITFQPTQNCAQTHSMSVLQQTVFVQTTS